jgi:uncharacterized membrane protein YdfJ with MMPL/SSD domain
MNAMIDLNTIIAFVLGSGGILSVSSWIKWRDSKQNRKLLTEDTSLTRLEEENKRQKKRADEAEESEDQMRKERNRANELAAHYKGRLIQAGLLEVDTDDDQR